MGQVPELPDPKKQGITEPSVSELAGFAVGQPSFFVVLLAGSHPGFARCRKPVAASRLRPSRRFPLYN